jgi:hypothetical protein
VEALPLQNVKHMNKSKALLCAIILIVDQVLNGHLSVEPSKDRYKEVQMIETVVVFTMKGLKTT